MKPLATLRLITAAVFSFAVNQLTADNHFGQIHFDDLSCSSFISGNGFGAHYSASAGIGFGKKLVVSGGPIFTSRTLASSGYFMKGKYNLMTAKESNNGHSLLYSFVTASRFNHQGLSAKEISYQAMTCGAEESVYESGYCELRYNGWEYAAGIGTGYCFKCGLMFNGEIAFSYYNVQRENHPETVIYKSQKDVSLQLGFNIGWKFGE